MRNLKQIEIAGISLTVKELTVGEVRSWFKSLESATTSDDVVGALLFDGFTLSDLFVMSDLKPEVAESMAQSEITKLADVCKELNPSFFALRARLEAIGRAATSA